MNAKVIRKGICLSILMVLFLSAVPVISAHDADPAPLQQASKAFSSVAKKAAPAVVFIKVEKTVETGGTAPFGNGGPFDFFYDRQPREYRQRGQGSGFIISENGYILTNNHVVGDADTITVKLSDGREFKAKRIGGDEKSDVAVIKIDGDNLPILPLGDSDELEVGEWVIAIGNPFGLAETLTFGIVSAKGRNTVGINDYEDFIQTDAAINPGNSGGPLINLKGQAIGINSAIYSSTGGSVGIGFAIPINMARNIKDQLVRDGKVTRGQLGVMIGELTQELADYFDIKESKGVVVSDVLKDSPAEKAGLQAGDIILKINDEDVESVGQLRNTVSMVAPGTEVELLIYRNGREKTVTVGIGELTDTIARAGASELPSKLGLTVQDLTEETRRYYGLQPGEGVVVSNVIPQSRAFEAGIRPGTIIISVNQQKVGSIYEFGEALKASVENGKVLLLIREQRYTRFVVLELE
ncbi:MAG: DegQ family serine endoprotease [Planctomycetota bacterium]